MWGMHHDAGSINESGYSYAYNRDAEAERKRRLIYHLWQRRATCHLTSWGITGRVVGLSEEAFGWISQRNALFTAGRHFNLILGSENIAIGNTNWSMGRLLWNIILLWFGMDWSLHSTDHFLGFEQALDDCQPLWAYFYFFWAPKRRVELL